jgi:hypothetical protein
MQNQSELRSSVGTLPSKVRQSADFMVGAVRAVKHLKAKPDRLKQILFTVEKLELYAKSAALSWRSFMRLKKKCAAWAWWKGHG